MARHWTCTHFTDHPLYSPSARVKPEEVWYYIPPSGIPAVTSSLKIKVACTECLYYEVGLIQQAEAELHIANALFCPRNEHAIRLSLFRGSREIPDSNPTRRAYFEARPDTLLSHLQSCSKVAADIQKRAADELVARRHHTAVTDIGFNSQPNLLLASFPPTPISLHTLPTDIPTFSSISNPSPYTGFTAPSPIIAHVAALDTQAIPCSSSPLLVHGAISRGQGFGTLGGKHSISAGSLGQEPWTPERHALFQEKLVRLTASAGLALSWVENPEFITFCQEFIPQALLPSRKTLSNKLLPRVLKDIRTAARIETHGQKVTVQCDGWTGINNHHFVAFMITTQERKVNDTTVERKTAEKMLAMMKDVIEKLRVDWGVNVIAFTTDASGESRKARRLLRTSNPHLVTPDCWAHQVNLIVGDYFKINGVAFLDFATKANDLITWLRSKTAVLGLIRDAAERTGGHHSYSVIRPVATRWTAYFLAYRRLIDLRPALNYVISAEHLHLPAQRQLIPTTGDKKAIAKAESMVNLIENKDFWIALERIQVHLLPLAIAANITQSTFCRLDEVMLTFSSLYWIFNTLDKPDEEKIRQHVQASIERRWAQSDQSACIAAVILNPFVRLESFNKDRHDLFSLAAISNMFSRLWVRFFGAPAPLNLHADLDDYLSGRGRYQYLTDTCLRLRGKAESDKASPDPLEAYRQISVIGDTAPQPPIIHLATHILSICANSASCERLFSTFGLILTKLRSRLGKQKMLDLAELKLHLRDEHLRFKTKEQLRQRTRAFTAAEANSDKIPQAESSIRGVARQEVDSASSSAKTLIDDKASKKITTALMNMTLSLQAATVEDDSADNDSSEVKHPLVTIVTAAGVQRVGYSFKRSAESSLDDEQAFYQLIDSVEQDISVEPDIDEFVEIAMSTC